MSYKRTPKNRLTIRGLVARQFRDDVRREKRELQIKRQAARKIYSGDRREAAIRIVIGLLEGWTLTKFEYEGPTRHAIRQVLVLNGHAWAAADDEAATLVADALRRMGAVRPSWDQGQPEYAVARENCYHCSRPLDEYQIARGSRFCSPECAQQVLERRNWERTRAESQIAQAAYRVVRSAALPARACKNCGRDFHPSANAPDQEFCSKECGWQSRRTIEDRICLHCHEVFRPHQGKELFCSTKCYRAHGVTTRFEKSCSFCGAPFIAVNSKAKYCSPSCQSLARQKRKGLWAPARLSVKAFDHYIALPNSSRPAWMTPAKFDEMIGD